MEDKYTFVITVKNCGLGPANIIRKELRLDDEVVGENEDYDKFKNFIKFHITYEGKANFRNELLGPGVTVDKGETITYLAFHVPKQNNGTFSDMRDVIEDASKNISIKLDYQCPYENTFECQYPMRRNNA